MAKAVDLKAMSDEELEQHGFELGRNRAEAEKHWRDQQMEQQAEVSRRSAERGGAAKPAEGSTDGE